MSLSDFYTDNEGNSPGYTRNTRKHEMQLAKAQRILSKKKKKSKNWEKGKKSVAPKHEKTTDSRLDFSRKLATRPTSEYDAVCIETLSLKGMSQTFHLGKSVHDPGFADDVSRLKQKAAETGTHVIQVDTRHPGSKLCSDCGYRNSALTRKDRNWTCPNYRAELSRDENAGKNLHTVGCNMLGLGQPSKPVEKVSDLVASVPKQSSVKQEVHRPLSVGQVTRI